MYKSNLFNINSWIIDKIDLSNAHFDLEYTNIVYLDQSITF